MTAEYASMLGAVASPVSPLDYQFSALLTPEQQAARPLPDQIRMPHPPPILKQVGGTCVGHSATSMRTEAEYVEHGRFPLPALDPYWLYRECKKVDGLPSGTEGTTLKAAMTVLRKKGQADKGGTVRKGITAYYSVKRDPDSICRALYDLTPSGVCIAGPWYESWFKPPSSGILPEPDREAGGHAYYAVGADRKRRLLLCLNSWGKDFALRGAFWLPFDYVGDLWEAWRTVDAAD